MRAATLCHLSGCCGSERLMIVRTILNSALSVDDGSGSVPSLAKGVLGLLALVHEQRHVAAVVDDEVRAVALGVGVRPGDGVHRALPVLLERLALPGEDGGRSAATMAAAAWSCVEKMLHEHQRMSPPSFLSVSMSTAVWIVMWSEPAMRAPLSGCAAPYSSTVFMRPGISYSASSISRRPKSASEMSATR